MTSGWVVIPDGQNVAEINLQLLPDDVPELEETYMVQLTSVDGGADLDKDKSVVFFTVLANDDPYGVFFLDPSSQSIIVNSDMGRYVQVNVSRLAGTFGNVTAQYQISFGKDNLTGTIEGNVLIRDGASYGVSTVPINNQVSLFLVIVYMSSLI